MGLPIPAKMALRWSRRVLVGFDQFLNAIGGGAPDQTISYRAALAQSKGSQAACVLCRFLDLFQADHCGITLRAHDTRRTLGG